MQRMCTACLADVKAETEYRRLTYFGHDSWKVWEYTNAQKRKEDVRVVQILHMTRRILYGKESRTRGNI